MILRFPGNQTVFLNQSAVFTCETEYYDPTWRINETRLENIPPKILSDLMISVSTTAGGSRLQTLTIPARAEYNGTKIECLVGRFGENVTLTIQGTV